MKKLGMLVMCLVCTMNLFAHDETKPVLRIVSVQGTGKLKAVPDIATLRIEVNAEGKSVSEVTGEVRQKTSAVMNAIKAFKLEDKDLQTQQYTVQPRFDYRDGRSKRIGYYASNQVAVIVRDLSKVGQILAAVTDVGANQVYGPEFGFDNPLEFENKALALAMEDARHKAKLLAEGAGAQLGSVQTINQSALQWPYPQPQMYAMRSMAAMADTAESKQESISAGQQTISANVSVSFLLK